MQSLRRHRRRKLLPFVVVILVIMLAVGSGFFFWKWQSLKSNQGTQAQESSNRVVDKVGQIYALPDEKPTVAVIQDKEKLKDQIFFEKAQNGDYLLMYSTAKLALIYREKDHKLINVGPIALDPNEGSQDQSAAQPNETTADSPTIERQP